MFFNDGIWCTVNIDGQETRLLVLPIYQFGLMSLNPEIYCEYSVGTGPRETIFHFSSIAKQLVYTGKDEGIKILADKILEILISILDDIFTDYRLLPRPKYNCSSP